ncbi:hypothetical protein MTR67_009198 [Solanum verrucosum]|uniref:Protein kinase domain-containing protein n=1 Tax=Solanum verrucosum TaxID=315347 RepID=A0AAF0Q3P5_SOLVR|nr:hypothetical protein MTR67_009198 [Solanum verrucosum]
MDITGTIPPQLGNLSFLVSLDLSKNNFHGELPPELLLSRKLRDIDLSYNNFTGEIPKGIANLPNLKWFILRYNKLLNGSNVLSIFNTSTLEILDLRSHKTGLTGVIPDEVGNLPELSFISLSFNDFTGLIPIGIFNISSLVVLGILGNHISGSIPSTIGNGLPNIEGIYLVGNNINGALPSSISNLSKLEFLELGGNELTGSIPESLGNLRLLRNLNLYDEIGNMRKLSTLELDDNDLTGIIPTMISSLKNLQRLSLGANRISGPFQIALCELPNLGMLNLSQNQMWGNIRSCLGDVTSLREIYLDSNNFSASIPSSLWNLKDILKLNLSSNFFNGSLPLEVGSLKAVTLLDLSRNHISGNIPSTLGGLQKLTQLSLAHNRIEGSIPDTFGELINLEAMDISYNKMSGVIPKSLEELKQLRSLNVSFNRLHGEIPSGGPFVNLTYQSFMSNEGLCGNSQEHFPACPSNSKNHSKSKKRIMIWIVVAFSVISVIVLTSAIAFVLMRHRGTTVNAEDEGLAEVAPPRISYYELQRATQGFDEINLLGSGSFGSVYKGTLADGMIVAVKVFDVQMEGTFQTFDRECEILRNLRHRNLTKIISSCSNLDFKALILEYMPNESLDKFLYSRDFCSSMMQRLNIMVDIASALEYLHHEESIAHTTTFATIGYIATEYGLEGLISKRSDVYSFGIMLLETFTKKKPRDKMFAGDLNLRSLVHNSLPDELDQIIDADLLTLDEENLRSQKLQCVSFIMELAMNCTISIPVERMNRTDVVTTLKKIKQKFSSYY